MVSKNDFKRRHDLNQRLFDWDGGAEMSLGLYSQRVLCPHDTGLFIMVAIAYSRLPFVNLFFCSAQPAR